jgi:hypothetical protein
MNNFETIELDYRKLPSTRLGARHLNSQYYYTGKPCGRNHIDLRYTSSGNCVTCLLDKRGLISNEKMNERSTKNIQRTIDALDAGETTYVPEIPCVHGHSLRYVGSNNCVECNKITMRMRSDSGYSKDRYYKKTYGISKEQFEQIVYDAYSKCEICGTIPPIFHLDHCHKTNKIRGVLCNKCNQALGLAQDSPEILRKMANYLEERKDGIPAS